MDSLENQMAMSFSRNYKLERAADDVLKEIRSTSSTSILKVIKNIFRVSVNSEVPSVVSTLIDSYKLFNDSANYYKLKKYVELFVRVHETSASDREKFHKELESNSQFKEQFCATVYTIVDRVMN